MQPYQAATRASVRERAAYSLHTHTLAHPPPTDITHLERSLLPPLRLRRLSLERLLLRRLGGERERRPAGERLRSLTGERERCGAGERLRSLAGERERSPAGERSDLRGRAGQQPLGKRTSKQRMGAG